MYTCIIWHYNIGTVYISLGNVYKHSVPNLSPYIL